MVLSVPWVEVCRSVSVHLLFNDGLLYSPRSGADSCCNEEIALQCKGIEMPGCWECKALHGVCGVCGVWEGGRKKEGDKKKGGRKKEGDKKKGGREGRKGGREGRKGGREGDKDFVVNVMEMATNCLHYVQCMRCTYSTVCQQFQSLACTSLGIPLRSNTWPALPLLVTTREPSIVGAQKGTVM